MAHDVPVGSLVLSGRVSAVDQAGCKNISVGGNNSKLGDKLGQQVYFIVVIRP